VRGPFYDCRIQDLDASDLVEIVCPCRHTQTFRPMQLAALQAKKAIPDYQRIVDLRTRFRCSQCASKGGASVRISSGPRL
jgi:hypothetical protein